MKEQRFGKLVRLLCRRRARTVGIEAGHIYTDERPGQEHAQGFEIGVELSGALILEGIEPTGIVFIDDYNPKDNILCLRGFLELARGCSFLSKHEEDGKEVVMESTMASGAEEIISKLAQDKLVKNGDGDSLFTTKHGVRLRHDDGRISCPALDAAFCLCRFDQFDFNVTILPGSSFRKYKQEQRKVRQLLRLLGWQDIPLANIFFQPDGDFSISLPKQAG